MQTLALRGLAPLSAPRQRCPGRLHAKPVRRLGLAPIVQAAASNGAGSKPICVGGSKHVVVRVSKIVCKRGCVAQGFALACQPLNPPRKRAAWRSIPPPGYRMRLARLLACAAATPGALPGTSGGRAAAPADLFPARLSRSSSPTCCPSSPPPSASRWSRLTLTPPSGGSWLQTGEPQPPALDPRRSRRALSRAC